MIANLTEIAPALIRIGIVAAFIVIAAWTATAILTDAERDRRVADELAAAMRGDTDRLAMHEAGRFEPADHDWTQRRSDR